MTRQVTVVTKLCCVGLVPLLSILISACDGDGDGVAPTTTASEATNTATTTTASLAEGADLKPLERAIVEALRRVDPQAATTERGFNDAWVEAVVEGQQILVHVAAPGIPTPGKTGPATNFSGVEAMSISSDAFGMAWRIRCELPEFGDRLVDIAFTSDPARAVPAVHRLLGCK